MLKSLTKRVRIEKKDIIIQKVVVVEKLFKSVLIKDVIVKPKSIKFVVAEKLLKSINVSIKSTLIKIVVIENFSKLILVKFVVN